MLSGLFDWALVAVFGYAGRRRPPWPLFPQQPERGPPQVSTTVRTGAACPSRIRLVLAGALARYPPGAGQRACFLQYMLVLRSLGHDVLWPDVLAGRSRF